MTGQHGEFESALAARYTIERELGAGGMATVYLARDVRHGREVAVKVLRPELTTALGAERFLREIRIAAGLAHPHILAVHDSGEAAGLLYYVMPYVGGESLRGRLDRERRMAVDDALRIASDVASGLAYAHAHGVVHRDVKPENVLIGEDGNASVADFGLARALDSMEQRLTVTGVGIGTPLYMSPEQASGERGVDARSDQYSLACVLYEMLAGEPPFHGSNVQALVAHHVLDTPAPVRHLRANVPPAVEAALARALSKVPADRYPSVVEFARAWRDGAATPPAHGAFDSSGTNGRWARRRAGVAAAASIAAVVATAAGLTAAARRRERPPAPDALRVAIAPVAMPSSTTSPGATFTTTQLADRLTSGFARWSDVRVVSPARVRAEIERDGGAGADAPALLAAARALGAGRLVRATAVRDGATLRLDAAIYDVAGDSILGAASATLAPGADTSALDELAIALARPSLPVAAAADGERASSDPAARRAYREARRALDAWDVAAAGARLGDAVAADPSYAQAWLWLAELTGWGAWGTRDDAAESGRRLEPLLARLAPHDSLLGAAVLLGAARDHPAACALYRRALVRQPAEFRALYGLGECESRDSVVVRAGRGFAFRGSWQAALTAYRQALDAAGARAPTFVYRRVLDVARTNRSWLRAGRLDADSSATFFAYGALVADTVAYDPIPVSAMRAAAPPDSRDALVTHNSVIARDVARRWTVAEPTNPDAHRALAAVLEASGDITDDPAGEPPPADSLRTESAVTEVRRARDLSTGASERVALAAVEARLLLKAGQFAAAARMADSVLRANATSARNSAGPLTALAALGGRGAVAAAFARRMHDQSLAVRMSTGGMAQLPIPLAELRTTAFIDAAVGACTLQLRRFVSDVDAVLPSYFPDSAIRGRMRDAIVRRPLSLAVPCLGASPLLGVDAAGDPLVRMQQAFARGDTSELRRQFATVRAMRRLLRPGEAAVDYTYQEAWLLLAVGDTALAVAHLDGVLNALPVLSARVLDAAFLDDVAQPAALVRVMALRGEIARHRAEDPGQRWSAVAGVLWKHADPAVTRATR